MNVAASIGWLLVGAGVYCAIRVWRLDGELRRSLPPTIELRPDRRAFRAGPEGRRADFFEDLGSELRAVEEATLSRLLPLRWQSGSRSASHAVQVTRIWRLIAVAFVLVVLGLSLLAAGVT